MSLVRCLHILWWSQLSAQWKYGWLYIHIWDLSHHSPPQGISIAVEVCFTTRPYCILLTEIHEVAGENQAKEPNVEGGDQLLAESSYLNIHGVVTLPVGGDRQLIQAFARCHLAGQHAACAISEVQEL